MVKPLFHLSLAIYLGPWEGVFVYANSVLSFLFSYKYASNVYPTAGQGEGSCRVHHPILVAKLPLFLIGIHNVIFIHIINNHFHHPVKKNIKN